MNISALSSSDLPSLLPISVEAGADHGMTGAGRSGFAAHDRRALVIADGSSPEIASLVKGARAPHHLVHDGAHPLAELTTALAGEAFETLHIVAHGRAGGFRIGGQWIDTTTLRESAALLRLWNVKRIALWSCEVGVDAQFIATLGALTSAEIYSSAMPLGRVGSALHQTVHTSNGGHTRSMSMLEWADELAVERMDFALAEVSVVFGGGYLGTQGTNTNQANNILTFGTLGIARIAFVQNDANGDGKFGDGGTQGNDLAGTIKIYLSSGTILSLTGALNWRETTGSKVEVLGFIFDSGQNASISYGSGQTYNIVGGTTTNTSTTLGLKSSTSTFTFVDAENRSGNAATSGLLKALNDELLATPQPVSVTLTAASVEEGGSLVYTVTLDKTSTVAQSYIFAKSGTATSGSDFNATFTFSNSVVDNGDGTITVPVGVGTFTITVATIDDGASESSETLTLAIGAKSGTGTITDNDTARLVLGTASGNTTEAGDSATFTVKLGSQPTSDVTVTVSSSDTTEGSVSQTLTFTTANWNTPQTVTVTGVDDADVDGDIAYQAQLSATSADSNYSGKTGSVNITNVDNDSAGLVLSAASGNTTEAGGTATFTVKLARQPTSDVTVTVSSNDTTEGTVTQTLTFTSSNWNTAQTVTVTGVDDLLVDGNIAYQAVLGATSSDSGYNGKTGSVNITNTDNDSAGLVLGAASGNTTEAGGTATFTVKLSSQPTADVTVTVSSSDTTEGTVTQTLTFTAANWNTPQTVTVTGADDTIVDGDIPYQALLSASSSDSNYSGKTGSVNLTNIDNDSAGLVLGAASGNTTEAGGMATFTVKLSSQPTADVTVTVSSSDTTEGTVTQTLTFTAANWNTSQTVTVTGADDPVVDGNIAYQALLSASSGDNGYDGKSGSVSITNTDNDSAGLVLGAATGNTTEGGGTTSFSVKLSSQPTSDVTVTVSSSDTTEGTVNQTLTFTAANWNTAQNVTVTGADDAVIDGDVAYQALLSASSSDSGYNGKTGTVNITNADNDLRDIDAPTVTITEDANNDGYINAAELSGDAGVRVTLPAGAVVGDFLNVSDGTTTRTIQLNAAALSAGYVDTSFAAPADGSRLTVSAYVYDSIGNQGGSDSDTALRDTTPPAGPVTVTPQTTNDTTPVITGKATVGAGETLTVTVNGKTYTAGDGQLLVSSGTWSLQIPVGSELASATYPVTATITDAAGNTLSDSTTSELTIKTSLTAGPLDMTDATDSGVSADDEHTNNGLPVLTFVGEPGLTLSLKGPDGTTLKEGTHYSVAYDTATGTYTVTLLDAVPGGDANPFGTYGGGAATGNPAATADGIYTLIASDNAGNSATVGTFVIDTTSPEGPVSVVPQITNDTTPLIVGAAKLGTGETLSVEVNGKTYRLGDGQLTLSGTTWTLQIPAADAMADATYPVTATITDLAGNPLHDPTTRELTIKTSLTAGPLDMTNATDSGVSADDEVTSNGLPVLTFIGEPGLVLSLKGPDGTTLTAGTHYDVAYDAATGTYTVTLLDAVPGGAANPFGTYAGGAATSNPAATADGTYTIIASDLAGNSQPVGTFVIDTTVPAGPVTVVAQTTTDTTPVITGTVSLQPGETLRVEVNGKTYTAGDGQLAVSGSIWSLQIPDATALDVKTYSVSATITDAAGNILNDATTGELEIAMSGELDPPSDTGARDGVTQDPTPEFNLNAGSLLAVGRTARLLDPSGAVVGSAPVTAADVQSGRINVPTVELDDGVYTFLAQIVDDAGKVIAEVPVTVTVVTDRDGVLPSVELATRGGDFNGDGVLDWLQNNVAQFPMASVADYQAGAKAPAASFGAILAGDVATRTAGAVKLDEGAQLLDIAVLAQPAPVPAGMIPATPLLEFSVTSAAGGTLADLDPARPGLQTRVVIELPQGGVAANTYLKWDAATQSYFEFLDDGNLATYDNGATLLDFNNDGRIDRVVITMTDGQMGDDDGVANGIVVDPGMLALKAQPVYGVGSGAADRQLSGNLDNAKAQATASSAPVSVDFHVLPAATSATLPMAAWRNVLTGDYFYAPEGTPMPYACYVPVAADNLGHALKAGTGAFDVHLFINAQGVTQLVGLDQAKAMGLAGKGFTDMGALFASPLPWSGAPAGSQDEPIALVGIPGGADGG